MQTVKVPEPTADDRKTIAREHSALFPTRMALARWTSGMHEPHLCSSEAVPLRSAWFAQAQRNFQAWLDHGGFTQYDEPQPSGPPTPDGKTHSADVCLD
jgi:hypothetical protein